MVPYVQIPDNHSGFISAFRLDASAARQNRLASHVGVQTKTIDEMKIGNLVEIKPLEKPLLTIKSEDILGFAGCSLLFGIFCISPYLIDIAAAMFCHSALIKDLIGFVNEVR